MSRTLDRVWALKARVQHSSIRVEHAAGSAEFVFRFGGETWTVYLTTRGTLDEVVHIHPPHWERTSLRALETAVSKRLEF